MRATISLNQLNLKMFHYIFFLTILFYLVISLATSTPTQFPPKGDGYTALLIPPLSPRSPYYSHILAANNLSTTLTNITLDRTHYRRWVQTQKSASLNAYSPITFNENENFHVMELYIGDPIQLVYGLFDTGSNLIWFKCEDMADEKGKLRHFAGSRSKTYNPIDCKDKTRCITSGGDMGCRSGATDGPCIFNVVFYSGEYGKGIVASDQMTFPPDGGKIVQDFKFGCSNDNQLSVSGIIGASYSDYSIPKQSYPENPQFSYCMSNDLGKINLIKFGIDADLVGQPIKFFRNDRQYHYFMDVTGLQVNGQDINVDPSLFKMSSDGNKGFIIDSGFSVTTLSSKVFVVLKQTIHKLLGSPITFDDFEMCYRSSEFGIIWPYKKRPKIGIKFSNSVFELKTKMVWHKMPSSNMECLQVHKTKEEWSIIGAEQLYDVNVGHDLNNNLLYLQHMDCMSF